MHVLIILDHPQSGSFCAAVAETVRQGAIAAGHTVEMADLAAENFQPAITSGDLDFLRGRGPLPAEIEPEQRRVDRADAIVFVFPIYWWSLPARLKGWIDRVFAIDWAMAYTSTGGIVGLLRDRPVHLLAVGATDAEALERHGYAKALETQIPYGIFRYCGLKSVKLHPLLRADSADPEPRLGHLEAARALGASIGASIGDAHPAAKETLQAVV